MQLNVIDKYLLCINGLGFIFFIINSLLYTYTPKGQIDKLLNIVSYLGGTLGILIAILLFDKKPVKDTMMSRVFVICVFVIQLVLYLIYKGYIANNITIDFWNFFASHRFLVIYLIAINMVTFFAFAIDKLAAINHKSRIRIITLLGFAFIGGSFGALSGMYILHHKTHKDYFTVGVPIIMLMQLIVLFYIMNMKI